MAVIVGGQELIEHIQFVQNSHSKAIEDGLSLNIYNRKDGYQSESNTSFMWTYLFMEVLLHMKLLDSSSSLPNQLRSVDEKEELLIKLRKKYADDEQCFKMIEEFAATYSSDHAVWWYTRDSPFYEELNKALRYRNLELLFLLRFFIVDIFQQLKTKCEQQRAEQQQHDGHSRRISTLLVYRGQLISSKEMGNLTHSTGEFVSTNAFMSATLKESVAREFLDKSPEDPSQASKSILFEIEITPYVKTRAFAKISTLSEYGAEDEVLFVPGTIFRIQKIYNEKKTNEVKIIKLTLCSKDDQDLKGLLNHWRQHIGYETNLASFGWLIMQSGQVDKALEFYRKLLKRLSPDDPLVKYCYNGVGVLYQNRKDYKDAIDCHKEALDIALETQDEPKWCAQGYSALADVYLLNGEPDRALELYQKALPIYSNEYGTEHRDTVKCYTKIGDVYQGKEDYSAAANSYKEALKRHRQLKPRSKDPLYLITSLTNLAQIYYMIGDYQSALTNYDEALTIYLRRSRSNDPKLGILYEDIGHVHRKRKEFPLALLSFHRAAEIFYYSYPGIDEHNIRIRKAIGYCNKKLRYEYFTESSLCPEEGRLFFGFRLKQVITENCQNGPLLAEPPTSPVLFSPLTYSPHQAISGKHSKDVTGTGIEEFDKNSTINKTLRTGTANEEELHPSGDRTVTTLISNRQQIHKKNPRIVDAESKPNLSQHRRIDSRRN